MDRQTVLQSGKEDGFFNGEKMKDKKVAEPQNIYG